MEESLVWSWVQPDMITPQAIPLAKVRPTTRAAELQCRADLGVGPALGGGGDDLWFSFGQRGRPRV
ncbi:hypothetical protein [Amycolatopsis regifaucium]|uniref:Uncharacterized protein n=1 Tax=Amycolatopsis regifaucium TaxID=546365 RepID=A0A154MTD3_9PSEU|nr:hypothetical protein [Amycolatopsis regifaucium]KZB87556.1 hypothetical protein AVL48_23355 [Amycolatopsis regifaucium]OKA08388.1 hypothetical protein ATP06_0214115 [Amycolatopsis regifaucium]